MKSGFLTLLGLPNAGKSSLLNKLVGEELAIVTPRAQTTWTLMRGYLVRPDLELVVTDTPGLQEGTKAINQALTKNVFKAVKTALAGNELVALAIDSYEFLLAIQAVQKRPTDLDKIKSALEKNFGKLPLPLPVIPILNKSDRVKKADCRALLEEKIQETMSQLFEVVKPVVWVSSRTGEGLDKFLEQVKEVLPEGESGALFNTDDLTDQNLRDIVAEYVREQCFLQLSEELPYSIAVQIDKFDEKDPALTRIEASLNVERDGQKAIVIGQGGLKLKSIGTKTRLKIEKLLSKKVFLGLRVKVSPHWSREDAAVKRFGYLEE